MPKPEKERIYIRKQISRPLIVRAIKAHAGTPPYKRGALIVSVEYLLELGAKTFLGKS